jgi:hypothetical protein
MSWEGRRVGFEWGGVKRWMCGGGMVWLVYVCDAPDYCWRTEMVARRR